MFISKRDELVFAGGDCFSLGGSFVSSKRSGGQELFHLRSRCHVGEVVYRDNRIFAA
jgi:hypothetical protein